MLDVCITFLCTFSIRIGLGKASDQEGWVALDVGVRNDRPPTM